MAASHTQVTNWRTIGEGATDGADAYLFPQIDSVAARGDGRISWRVYVKLMNAAGEFIPLEPYFDGEPTPPGVVGWIKVDSTTTRGNIKASAPTIVTAGKNIGRKNATNILQQALRDALGLHTKQLKKAASVPLAGKKLFFPMLAQVLSEQKKSIWDTPGKKFLSPKLDGLRAVFTWDGNCLRSYSRTITPFPGPEVIHAELREPLKAQPNLFLDGEFYFPGMLLQDINSAVRGNTGAAILYYVYDCFVANGSINPEPFHQRLDRLKNFFAQNPQFENIKLVQQHEVADEASAVKLYEDYLDQSYEGAMIRLDTPYDSRPNNYHSKTLLKMKPRLDAEFELIGWERANKGKAAGALMLICKNDEGMEFRVTPALPIEERIALAEKMAGGWFEKEWRGRFITVHFATWSSNRIPQQPTTTMQTRID